MNQQPYHHQSKQHALILAGLSALLFSVSPFAVSAFETKAKQAIIVDDTTQTVLFTKEADTKMYPSSMSKLMTLYMLFDKIKTGAITLDTTFPVSEKAWRMGGSKMFVPVNAEVRVEDLILGIIVLSGNDACVVAAEGLAGSEEAFAKKMTEKATEIGLKGSHFTNSTGWPDEQHYMTAADLATLSARLVHDFPEFYPYFKQESFAYSGITQPNRNRLLSAGVGVDGLKTGHTEAAGYGIAVSARQPEGERRVHVVVNGLESDNDRLSEARSLVEYGFREFEVKTLKEPQAEIARLPVWMGAEKSVSVGSAQPLTLAVPRERQKLRFIMKAQAPVQAPIEAGAPLGTLEIYHDTVLMKTIPLIAAQDVAPAGWFDALMRKAKLVLGLS